MQKTSAKIITLGEGRVGKTSLIARFVDDQFMFETPLSTGISTRFIDVEIERKKYKVQIDDTAGQEIYQRILTPNYFRNADGILLIYDLNNNSTVKGVERWFNQIMQYAETSVDVVIVGNKADLVKEADIEEAKKIVSVYNRSFVATSAKTGMGVTEAFTELITKVISRNKHRIAQNTIILSDQAGKPKKKCC